MTYQEAINSSYAENWKEAMVEEISSFYDTDTVELVPKPAGKKIMSTKWVFTPKNGPNGEFAKARLVAMGCQDKRNWSETAIYSPVINQCVLRFLMSTANHYDLDLVQLDVKNAFLYGDIDYEVYIEIPEGVGYDRREYAFRLKKSLYGLKTASKSWFIKLSTEIEKMGYQACEAEQCLFYKRSNGKLAIILKYTK